MVRRGASGEVEEGLGRRLGRGARWSAKRRGEEKMRRLGLGGMMVRVVMVGVMALGLGLGLG